MANGAPRWVWIFTPLVALSFAVFLLYLTTIPAGDDIDKITQSLSEDAKKVQNQISNKAKQAVNEGVQRALRSELPDNLNTASVNKAVNNFEFFEILENNEIKVEEVAEYKSTPKGTDKDGNKIE